GGPGVVDLVHNLDQLRIRQAHADAEDAVHHLRVDTVDLLVPAAQRGGRRVRAALVEAHLEHPLHVLGVAALYAVEAEAEAAEDAKLLALRVPARAVGALADL